MICLTCRHLHIDDWEENRVFRCGHSYVMNLDSNDAAPVIVYLEYGTHSAPLQSPPWCPLYVAPLPEQMELFDTEVTV